MVNTLVALSEAAAEEGGVSPYLIGIVTFAILTALLLAVVSFGGGRDHS